MWLCQYIRVGIFERGRLGSIMQLYICILLMSICLCVYVHLLVTVSQIRTMSESNLDRQNNWRANKLTPKWREISAIDWVIKQCILFRSNAGLRAIDFENALNHLADNEVEHTAERYNVETEGLYTKREKWTLWRNLSFTILCVVGDVQNYDGALYTPNEEVREAMRVQGGNMSAEMWNRSAGWMGQTLGVLRQDERGPRGP